MRKLLLALTLAFGAFTTNAQVVSTFDTLHLSKPDTFYVNYSMPVQDVGFDDGLAHFTCIYDTAFGGLWSSGFIYSNMTDSVTSGFMNMYAAKTAQGVNGSSNYAVYFHGYGGKKNIKFHGAQAYRPQGFYITNSTYAYNSMRDGDFVSRKFGDTTGTGSGLPQGSYPDWFKLTIYGYSGGAVSDSVEFYLADFRFTNDAQDYIIKDWQWVDLTSLNFADSLDFNMTSSDNGQFGMNTPAYFCMDNLSVIGLITGVNDVQKGSIKIYPNPATDNLTIEMGEMTVDHVVLLDMSGKVWGQYEPTGRSLNVYTGQLPAGMYMLQLGSSSKRQTVRFMKQ